MSHSINIFHKILYNGITSDAEEIPPANAVHLGQMPLHTIFSKVVNHNKSGQSEAQQQLATAKAEHNLCTTEIIARRAGLNFIRTLVQTILNN